MELMKAEAGKNFENDLDRTLEPIVLKLEVVDTGVGVSPEQQKRIFKPYSQAKISDYRKHGGTGLGLSIVAKLIQIMGGSIHLKSKLDVGSTFTIYVPLRITRKSGDPSNNMERVPSNPTISLEKEAMIGTEEPVEIGSQVNDVAKTRVDSSISTEVSLLKSQPAPISQQLVSSTTKPVPAPNADESQFAVGDGIILIVDDNAINRKLLGKMLSKFKLNYTNAGDGQEAVTYMKASRNFTSSLSDPNVQLILMDWSMPVMNGCDATRAIRDMGLVDVPIVALTACALEEGLQELMDAGANQIATKPIPRKDLLDICHRYLPSVSSLAK